MAGLLTAAFGCGKARPYFRAAAKLSRARIIKTGAKITYGEA
jgi:hypothetical protein